MNSDAFNFIAILGQLSLREIGQYHLIFFYFPIILFTGALIADILNYFGYTRAFKFGNWLIICGVIACMPTLFTGLAAAFSFDQTNPILLKHQSLGYATAISGSFYAGIRISTMFWKLPLLPSHYMGLSLLLVALVTWTCDYGGLLTYGSPLLHQKMQEKG